MVLGGNAPFSENVKLKEINRAIRASFGEDERIETNMGFKNRKAATSSGEAKQKNSTVIAISVFIKSIYLPRLKVPIGRAVHYIKEISSLRPMKQNCEQSHPLYHAFQEKFKQFIQFWRRTGEKNCDRSQRLGETKR
jgi:hypothetical protein